MFESIRSIRPYFHSLREVKENVSLDIKLPLSWSYSNIIKPYSTIAVKVQDKNENFNLVSLISQSTQNGYDVVFACANEIVTKNKEEEEKQTLFQQKVKELQQLFKNESLDKLKDINLITTYGQEIETGSELVGDGEEEGQLGDRGPQESDD